MGFLLQTMEQNKQNGTSIIQRGIYKGALSMRILQRGIKSLKGLLQVGKTTVYLSGDIVRLPSGQEAEVIEQRGGKVDVYNEKQMQLDTFYASELVLLEAVDSLYADSYYDDSDTITTDSYYDSRANYGKQTTMPGLQPTKQPYKKYYPKVVPCGHNRDKFQLRNGEVIYLSSRSGSLKKEDRPDITMGCYLDDTWMKARVMFTSDFRPDNNFSQLFKENDYPYIIVNWSDMGVVPLTDFSEIVAWCMTQIKHGEKLDIACVGGHGRTGTLLAGILLLQNYTADEAIDKVRKEHCNRAIETVAQEQLIKQYYNALTKVRKERADEPTVSK